MFPSDLASLAHPQPRRRTHSLVGAPAGRSPVITPSGPPPHSLCSGRHPAPAEEVASRRGGAQRTSSAAIVGRSHCASCDSGFWLRRLGSQEGRCPLCGHLPCSRGSRLAWVPQGWASLTREERAQPPRTAAVSHAPPRDRQLVVAGAGGAPGVWHADGRAGLDSHRPERRLHHLRVRTSDRWSHFAGEPKAIWPALLQGTPANPSPN